MHTLLGDCASKLLLTTDTANDTSVRHQRVNERLHTFMPFLLGGVKANVSVGFVLKTDLTGFPSSHASRTIAKSISVCGYYYLTHKQTKKKDILNFIS